MKSQIFIFLVLGICFNIVAPYHQYRQGAYPEWSNNQNYPPNPNPAYSLRQPAAINYGAPQPVVNYVQDPPEPDFVQVQNTNFSEQKRTQESIYAQQRKEVNLQQRQQQVAESQSDAIFTERAPAPLPQAYPESPRPYSPSSYRRYESYGAGHQSSNWHAPSPANPVYDNYSPQVPSQWPTQTTYQPVPPISKKSYPQPASYPQWQSNGYKAVQHQNPYYGDSFDERNSYNAPAPQQQYTSTVEAQADSEASDTSVQEILASKPKVKEYLAASHKRYILIHQNNTIEHVDVIDDNLLGKTQRKSSDLINDKDIQEKIIIRPQENYVPHKIASSTPVSDYQNQNPRPNVSKETRSPVTVKDVQNKNYYNPAYEPIQTNAANLNEGTISSEAKPAAHNNHYPIPVFKPAKNHVVEQNLARARTPPVWNNNYRNPNEPQKSKTDIIFTIEATNDKKYNNQNPIYNSPSTNKENNRYPSRNINFNTFNNSPRVPNSNDDTEILVEYTNNNSPATYYPKETDASNPPDKHAVSGLSYILKHPSKSEDINTRPTFTPPEPSDYEIFDNFDQIQASLQESNDDTSSNVSRHPEDGNPPKDKFNNHVATTESSVLLQQDRYDNEKTDVDDDNNEGTIFETESNSTDTQDTNESELNNDDEQSMVDSAYTDSYKSSSTSSDDIVSLPPIESASPLNEDSLTDIDATKIFDEEEAGESDNVDLIESAKPENEFSKNEDTVDSENDTKKYDEVYFFDVKLIDSYIEKTSRTYMTKTGTTVEDKEEVVWEHKGDTIPIKITTTKIIWNPGPGFARPQKGKSAQVESADGAEDPDCTS